MMIIIMMMMMTMMMMRMDMTSKIRYLLPLPHGQQQPFSAVVWLHLRPSIQIMVYLEQNDPPWSLRSLRSFHFYCIFHSLEIFHKEGEGERSLYRGPSLSVSSVYSTESYTSQGSHSPIVFRRRSSQMERERGSREFRQSPPVLTADAMDDEKWMNAGMIWQVLSTAMFLRHSICISFSVC